MKDEFAVAFGTTLRIAAWYRSRTTQEIADALGVSVETVRRWMRGNTTPQMAVIAKLCTYLEVPADLVLLPPPTRQDVIGRLLEWDRERGAM